MILDPEQPEVPVTQLVVAVIGLGYVGLPLAVEFARHYDVIGFDVNPQRIAQLRAGHDRTLEVSEDDLAAAQRLQFTNRPSELVAANVFVIAAPTPIDDAKQPDLEPLLAATRMVASVLKAGDTVVYESTVYPGATEEVCVPVLESGSGLQLNVDFSVGYSPERINPGDKTHRLPDIRKITSGSSPEAARFVDDLYARIITAGTHRASSIRVAEAAKVIENTQRDVNIALINEIAVLFNTLGIDTLEVLEAAGTKWNFLPFRPGLVGGHCIGVDPYYLTFKAQQVGHHPEVILAGRRINDGMGQYVADQLVLAMVRKERPIAGARVLVLGLTFKENCPDIRNSRVVDLIEGLQAYGIAVDVCDPWVDAGEARETYGVELVELDHIAAESYDAAVLAVRHQAFERTGSRLREIVGDGVIYDVKGILGDEADERL